MTIALTQPDKLLPIPVGPVPVQTVVVVSWAHLFGAGRYGSSIRVCPLDAFSIHTPGTPQVVERVISLAVEFERVYMKCGDDNVGGPKGWRSYVGRKLGKAFGKVY